MGRARNSVFECCGKAWFNVGNDGARARSLIVFVDVRTGRDFARLIGVEIAAVVGSSVDPTLVG